MRARRWTAEQFFASRDVWQELLARSEADRLFMSFDWISSWWRHHEAPLKGALHVLGIYSPEGDLCGIAPFYSHRAIHRGFLAARRLELLGSAWRDSSAIFSEYLDVIAPDGPKDSVCAAVREWLRESREWDELLLCNLREGSVAARLAESMSEHAYVREVETMEGWSIALPASFEEYAARLSSNTRRKTLNQRDKPGELSFEMTLPAQRQAALERLEAFVARRWGPASGEGGLRRRFHAELIERSVNDGSARLSELRAGGERISVMLNIRVDRTEYYLQSGFDETLSRGISLGYLHLGYAIEAACRDGIRSFDFLAGRGLHRDYKRDFAAASTPLRSLHVVRKPLLRGLFRAFDRLGGRTSHTVRKGP